MNTLKPVDHTILRINQATIIILLILAFILNTPWLVMIVAAFMLVGSLLLRKAGFYWVTKYGLRPFGLARADTIPDHPEPHLFAQGFGGAVLAGASAALFSGAAGLGWGLAWLVVALAALNLFAGFCVGCAMYYWLNRVQAPGFVQAPPEGTFPGMRPQKKA